MGTENIFTISGQCPALSKTDLPEFGSMFAMNPLQMYCERYLPAG